MRSQFGNSDRLARSCARRLCPAALLRVYLWYTKSQQDDVCAVLGLNDHHSSRLTSKAGTLGRKRQTLDLRAFSLQAICNGLQILAAMLFISLPVDAEQYGIYRQLSALAFRTTSFAREILTAAALREQIRVQLFASQPCQLQMISVDAPSCTGALVSFKQLPPAAFGSLDQPIWSSDLAQFALLGAGRGEEVQLRPKASCDAPEQCGMDDAIPRPPACSRRDNPRTPFSTSDSFSDLPWRLCPVSRT